MQNRMLKITLLLSGGFLFNLLFWGEKLGINLLLFTLSSCITAGIMYKPVKLTANLLIAFAGTLIFSAEVVWLNTDWAVIGWFISFVLFTALLHQPALRSLLNIIPEGVSVYVLAPIVLVKETIKYKPSGISKRLVFKTLQISFLPLIIFLVFYFLYQSGNAMFEILSNNILTYLTDCLSHIFDYFSFTQFLYFLLGIIITGALIVSTGSRYFAKLDAAANDSFSRKTLKESEPGEGFFEELWKGLSGMLANFTRKTLALKTEYVMALFTLLLLNVLLLTVNSIDVLYLWVNFSYKPDMNLSAMTHDGINMLIVSIVLAMLVLIYFFRGNLNFYKKNKTLRVLALGWLAQNFFLACSAFLRDYHYMQRFGLTYKRIGIVVYVALVLVGLCTMLIKIRKQKTLYYLLRVNALAAFLALMLMGSFDWDKTIVEYNIENRATIYPDVDYIFSLSNRALPYLLQHNEQLKTMNNSDMNIDGMLFNMQLDFRAEQNGKSWLSWNYADYCTANALKQKY